MSTAHNARDIMPIKISLLDPNKIGNKFIRILSFWYHNKQLKKITNINDFNNYLIKLNYVNYNFYKRQSLNKRKEFTSFVEALDINLEGLSFLDIGPGYGDALDICHERRAAVIHFIENDPFLFHFNRIKGFAKGYYCSHRTSLHKLNGRKYNFIWLKGSINVDQYAINELWIKNYYLDYWLRQIERLAASQCHIMICPYWRHDGKKPFVDDIFHNIFTNIMLKHNFTILPDINDFCKDIEYPIAFYKFIEK
ncbi:MAG: hypothetical protein M1438_10625 [Deltaproteobacteria bacterium]|nr:hypothetical protein [Deltaproteobacteria bacterium]